MATTDASVSLDNKQAVMNTRPWMSGMISFVGWTVTSFLCHQSAKLFLRTATKELLVHNGLLWASVITVAQAIMCYLLTDVHLTDAQSTRAQSIVRVKVVCHILATMATNYSMTLVHASSTFAIKLLEPITSAFIQRIVLGTSLSLASILSLPVIIGGAVIFCGSSVNSSSSILGIAMAFGSNLILAFRNVAIKLEQGDSSMKTVQLRAKRVLIQVLLACVLLVISMEFLSFQKIVPKTVTFLIATAATSSVFHVTYSYISTNVVLLYMSVVSHSVANIFKRVLVVLMLYSVGHREAGLVNFIGLVVCALGLFMYLQSKVPEVYTAFTNTIGSNISRLFVVLLMMTCVGQFVYIPKTSSIVRSDIPDPDTFTGATFGKDSLSTYLSRFNLTPYVPYNDTAFRDEFLKRRLINTPKDTYHLSRRLSRHLDIVKEAQRIHFNVFSDLLAPHKYAIMLDLAAFENKGDPAIATGEVYLVRRMGLKVLYYCTTGSCADKQLDHAKALAKQHPKKKVVIMIQGGGNLVGYSFHDFFRQKVIALFPGYHIVLFPQSIYVGKGAEKHVQFCREVYRNATNFTMMIRDRLSFNFAMKNFKGPGNKIILMPDMAFQIGALHRFISPMYDILWLRRDDEEVEDYDVPPVPLNVSLRQIDWFANWPTPRGGNNIENAFLMAMNGITCLQRGRVVITDRLHGHILSVLLNIPHVLLDTSSGKLTSYHDTWTWKLPNTLVAHSPEHALQLGIKLLRKYNDTLTPIAPFMNISEYG